jgi:hypothetical protein
MTHHTRTIPLCLVALAASLAACSLDPLTVEAPFSTTTDSFAVSALTRTAASSRALWRIGDFRRYRLDSIGGQFDVGFDILPDGQIAVYPARSITSSNAGTAMPQVSLLKTTRTYRSADRAPETGYTIDTAIVVRVRQTVYVRTESDFCSSQRAGGTLLYAKFVVDSVNPLTRQLLVRSTIQPSCNFRSFAEGTPTF